MPDERKPNGLNCSICGDPLVGKQRSLCGKRTCKRRHSAKRASEKAAVKAEAITAIAKNEAVEAVRNEIQQQVGSVVREALTDEVLAGLSAAVKLIPDAIGALGEILMGEADPDQKRQAANTLLRYTMGNSSIAPPSLEQVPAPLQVYFDIPGGEAHPQLPSKAADAVEATAVEEPAEDERQCMECNLWKPAHDFVGKSDRCQSCDAGLRDRIAQQYGKIQLG